MSESDRDDTPRGGRARQRRVPSRALALAVALVACAGQTSESSFHASDSAGVRLTVSTAPAWTDATRWQIDSTPLLDIGGDPADSMLQFASLAGGRLLSDSLFIVAERSDRTLRFYDARGALRSKVGRKGGGPGEYESLSRLRRAGDSLLVWDGSLRRVTLLDSAGRHGRSDHLDWAPEGRWADGRLLVSASSGVNSRMPIMAVRETLQVLRARADGTRDTLLGRWPGRETIAVTTPQIVSSIESPYGLRTSLRWHPRGFWLGTGDAARIDRYDVDGRLAASVRWSPPVARTTAGEVSAWRDSVLRGYAQLPPELQESFNKGAQLVEFPDARPAYRTFTVSAEGDLWVERMPHWRAGRAPSEWDVIDSTGRWLGAVTVPSAVVPLDIRRGVLLAQWEDPDGVPHIRLYAIRRPE